MAYARIAASIGRDEEAADWRACAERLGAAILDGLVVRDPAGDDPGRWRRSSIGFHHDAFPSFAADLFGYDPGDLPQDFLAISRATYPEEADRALARPYDGSGGIGYNTAHMAQNALLLDRTGDAWWKAVTA